MSLTAQQARFARLDPWLPEALAPPPGTLLRAATAAGEQVSGSIQLHRNAPGSADLLWAAAEVWQLFPLIGETGTEGMDVLLRAWRAQMDAQRPGADSACAVTWPSRDAEAIRAFLDHGLAPASVLAIRTAPPQATDSPVTVRRATAADFDRTLALALEIFDYSAGIAGPRRADTSALLAPMLRRKLDEKESPVWLAELDGVPVGMADCGWVESTAGGPGAELLPHGRWGYVNNVGTTAAYRGRGVGRAVAETAHAHFHRAGALGTYLYYHPANPLSPVFWHRQGYRPLQTFWEVRPASLLR